MTVQELVDDLTQTAPRRQLSSCESEELADVLAHYLERLEKGESPDTAAIVAEHPELSDELRESFAKLEVLHHAAIGLTDGGETLDELCVTDLSKPHTLGDFRLVRPIGRGGMGVVYEAEQISLNRRVALKTLPLAAVLDPKQLARFKNEAQAAASLDHPHIVSVYAVGSDRGVHYYAMQLIDGLSVAEVLEQLKADGQEQGVASVNRRLPAPGSPLNADTSAFAAVSTLKTSRPADYFRTIARLGIQAAEALHYAHEMGLVHRDVKPSNLLFDNHGTLYVTDFGLAMTQSGSNLTISGDLLGTLRYMSPEQASGHRAMVDRRTDIYSLGASLYELATLQPAFPEEDRTQLLQQIASELPQPPGQINRAVPKDLETIILKAMAKEVADRYATTQDMADDLCRFLNDEPIRARRPGPGERIAKWSRRHWSLAATVFIAMILSIVGLSISALMITQQRNIARAAAVEAKTQRTRAESNLHQARAAVDSMITKAAGELADRPLMDQLRRELLEEALQFYQGFLHESDDDPEIRYETALIHGRIFDIHKALGDAEKCLEHAQTQLHIVRVLQREFPKETRYRELLADSCTRVGSTMAFLGRGEAKAYLDMSLAEWTRLAADTPKNPLYRKQIAAWYFLYRFGARGSASPTEGSKLARKGLQLLDELEQDFPSYPKDNRLRAKGESMLGFCLLKCLKFDEAEIHVRNALEFDHDDTSTQRLVQLLLMRGALKEAEEILQNSINKYEGLRKRHPDTVSPVGCLANHLGLLSETLMISERWEEAEIAARRRLEIDTEFYNRSPAQNVCRRRLAWSLYDLGHVLFGAGKHQDATEAYKQAITLFEGLAEEFDDARLYQNNLAWVWSSCPEKELRDSRRALDVAHRALKLSPNNADDWLTLARAQYNAGDYRSVVASTEEAQSRSAGDLPHDAKLVLAMAYHQLGDQQSGRELYDQTVDELNNKQGYSEWYTMEFRVLRADADKLFSEPSL